MLPLKKAKPPKGGDAKPRAYRTHTGRHGSRATNGAHGHS